MIGIPTSLVLNHASPNRRVLHGIALIILASTTGCTPHGGNDPSAAPLVAPSVDPESTTFTCPGVPDSSLHAMLEEPSLSPVYDIRDGGARYLTCSIYQNINGESTPTGAVQFGREIPGRSPWDLPVVYYTDRVVGEFSVPGVPEATGEVRMTESGGGGAAIECGDAFVVASLDPNKKMIGDMRSNLINLVTSMAPWVCNGEPIPDIDVPLATRNPSPSPTTETPEALPEEQDG
ncbi:MAG: hypothetical protein Q4E00_05995 [Actinomyces bowdenii]|nr:hypothetical protein [Actinomyces bowdenii]